MIFLVMASKDKSTTVGFVMYCKLVLMFQTYSLRPLNDEKFDLRIDLMQVSVNIYLRNAKLEIYR